MNTISSVVNILEENDFEVYIEDADEYGEWMFYEKDGVSDKFMIYCGTVQAQGKALPPEDMLAWAEKTIVLERD